MDLDNNKESSNGGNKLNNDIKSKIFPEPRKVGGRQKREIRKTERTFSEAAYEVRDRA